MASFKFRLPTFGELTRDQRRAVNSENAIIVTGVPGCGKTVVSVYRGINSTNNAQLFTFTRLLRAYIRSSVLISNRQYANNIHSIYSWYWINCSEMLSKEIRNEIDLTTRLNNKNIRIGEAIFDEGQDLPLSLYKAFDKVCDSISVGADEAQQLYPEKSDTTEAGLKNIFPNNNCFELTQNFRNTYEIYKFARQFVKENPRAFENNMLERLEKNNSTGDLPYLYIKNNQSETNIVIKSIIDNYGDETIGILVDKQERVDYYYGWLSQVGIEVSKYHNNLSNTEKKGVENALKNILVSTYKSVKGLEFDNVIMPDFENADIRYNKSYYVGATRARRKLFVISNGNPSILSNFDKSTFTIY